jgi:hypothetical protein
MILFECTSGPLASDFPPRLAARHRAEAVRRRQLLDAYDALVRQGVPVVDAARQVGAAIASLWRWRRRWREFGLAGLEPRRNNGRPPFTARFANELTPAVIGRVQRLALAHGLAQAWRLFAASSHCPPRLAQALARRKQIPPTLLVHSRLSRLRATVHRGVDFILVTYGPAVAPRSRRRRPAATRRQNAAETAVSGAGIRLLPPPLPAAEKPAGAFRVSRKPGRPRRSASAEPQAIATHSGASPGTSPNPPPAAP